MIRKKLEGKYIATRINVPIETWQLIQDWMFIEKKRLEQNVSYAAALRYLILKGLGKKCNDAMLTQWGD